jgi:hypothetical protein
MMIVIIIFSFICTCFFTAQLHFLFAYKTVSVNIFSYLELSLLVSSCFNPAMYHTALFCRVNFRLVNAFTLCPHMTLHDKRGQIKPFLHSYQALTQSSNYT